MALAEQIPSILESRYFAIAADDIDSVVEAIPDEYKIIAPVKKDFAVSFEEVNSANEIAFGYESEEYPGHYRLHYAGGKSLDKARSMNSPKYHTHIAKQALYRMKKNNGEWDIEEPEAETAKQAFFGVAPCDVWGMYILDQTFAFGPQITTPRLPVEHKRQEPMFRDPHYEARRQDNLIIAINCLHPGNNCFCISYGYGPELKGVPFDLLLTLVDERYLIEVGSEKGANMLLNIPGAQKATGHDLHLLRHGLEIARHEMPKAFEPKTARESLDNGYKHPYWLELEERCLSCGNCIWVCPTCYCYQLTEQASIDGKSTGRARNWDACHHLEFAGVHGHNFRESRADRLKHWVNHKVNWTVNQYGVTGCMGCGRCITWCPTGIDIAETVHRIGGENVGFKD